MRIAQINGGVFGSTGKIMFGIAELAKENGMEVKCYSPVTSTNKDKEPNQEYEKIGSYASRRFHVLLARITGYNGCFAYFETKKMLKSISEFKPDIIHLHNLHDSYINLPMLFHYIKKHDIAVVWTLHDCWSFTGHCAHFTIAKCDKWKTGCKDCPQYHAYPKSIFDNSKKMYRLKKKWFTGIKNMIIATPSQWLGDLVKQSFLSDYEVKVIHNGIDLSLFRPTNSDFREKYGIEDKKVLLGISFAWNDKKGLDVFIELAKRLNDSYQVVLVGTDDTVDAKLPANIISIHRTQDQTELAEIYSASDVFVNPTREENFPTVNIEALSCGIPIITFKTGGSPEIIDSSCGHVVNSGDIDAMEFEIKRIFKDNVFSKDACIHRAALFDAKNCFAAYIQAYRERVPSQPPQ